jgi:thimet oligopeptidase
MFLGLTACHPPGKSPLLAKEDGPLTRTLEIPIFESTVEAVETAERDIRQASEYALEHLIHETAAPTFAESFGELDRIQSELFRVWSRLYLLMDTSPHPAVREAAAEAVIRIEHFSINDIDLNEGLYQTLKTIAGQLDVKNLSAEELRYVNLVIRSYESEGMALQADERQILKGYQERLSELTTAISANINNALGDVTFHAHELAGLSAEQLTLLTYDAVADLYTVRSSNSSTYRMIMRKVTNPATRKKTMRARYQRAMNENGALMLEVLQLRQKIAHILSFRDWADYRIDGRMAHDGETAQNFLENLDERLADKFLREQNEILEMKHLDLELPDQTPVTLPLEDVDYYMDQLVQTRYTVDTEALRVYFPENEVIPGMMQAIGEVLGFTYQEKPAPEAWVDDLRYFEIYDQPSGRLMGALYLDLHPRPGKYTHFAEYSLVDGRRREDGSYQAPVCAIVGNFPAPTLGRPSLWSYEELGTFIHEFGHALHTILTEAQLNALAGTSVPQDFVEVASQVLERWLEDPAVLNRFARHYENGEPFPVDTLQKILNSQSALVGHSYRRQISFGLADLRLHRLADEALLPQTPQQLYAMSNADFSRYYPVDPDTGFLASFEHLFAGYDAGYYGYAWADVMAADIAGTFRRSVQGFQDDALGHRLRMSIYAKGNTREPDESIREYLGRDFNDKAFLEELFRVP